MRLIGCFTCLIFLISCGGGSGGGTTLNNAQASILVATSNASLSNCSNGGATIDMGFDTNGNGVLDPSEITSTKVVCNGLNGNAIVYGQTDPSTTDGVNGDFYINISNTTLWGPKLNGVWTTSGIALKGNTGTSGANGSAVLNGTGVPGNGLGSSGDFYIDTTNVRMYGPKANNVWPAIGISLTGTAGAHGTNGLNGNTILNGIGAPIAAIGMSSDFYLDTSTTTLYGPKSSAGWPNAGISLVGAAGPVGANGSTILSGSSVPANTLGANGDFYIDGVNSTLYGPKSGGVWPSGTSLRAHFPTVIAGLAGVQSTAPNTNYLATATTGVVNFVLPTSPNPGDVVQFKGVGEGGWSVLPNANQTVVRNGLLPGWSLKPSGFFLNNVEAWQSLASSSDGTRLVAGSVGGHIYTSIDSGATWTQRVNGLPSGSSTNWRSLVSSSDGVKLFAINDRNAVYMSPDGGANWSLRFLSSFVAAIASSSDGQNIVAVEDGGSIYISSDQGIRWMQVSNSAVPLPSNWLSVASSSNGSRLVAGNYAGGLYTSSDSGVTWVQQTLPTGAHWFSLASSGNGERLMAITYNGIAGSLYISSDYGSSWVQSINGLPNNAHWISVTSSDDGLNLALVADGGGVYASADGGHTWTMQSLGLPVTASWKSIASNSTGTQLIAATSSGGLYIGAPVIGNGIRGSAYDALAVEYLGNGTWGIQSGFGIDFLSY